MAPEGTQFSGTRWQRTIEPGNIWILECLGSFKNPNARFLDGRTHDGTIGLAPSTAASFTGTRWHARQVTRGVTLECLGDFKNSSFRFLDGRTGNGTVGLAPTTSSPFTGTVWFIEDADGQTIDDGTNLIPADR
jgi:hypothetical protein